MAEPRVPLRICNLALIKHLGQDPLASWDDDTTMAGRLLAVADMTAAQILYAAFWKSGRLTLDLDADTTRAAPEFGYAYGLPPDVVRVWRLGADIGFGWEVRSRTLLANQGPRVTATAVAWPTADGWTPALECAVAAAIAFAMAPKCGLDETALQRIERVAGGELARAKVMEAGEGSPGRAEPLHFVRARFG